MKLEYVVPNSTGIGLVCLYGFPAEEAVQLLTAVSGLASGDQSSVAAHNLPYIEVVGECRLTLRVRSWDQALVCVAPPCTFECGLTPEAWDNVAGLIEPFAEGTLGYQWLVSTLGEAALVLSVDGQW